MYKLYAKQKVFKIVDDYQIFDEDKNPVYQVDQDFTFFGHRVEVKKLDSDLSFLIEKVTPGQLYRGVFRWNRFLCGAGIQPLSSTNHRDLGLLPASTGGGGFQL